MFFATRTLAIVALAAIAIAAPVLDTLEDLEARYDHGPIDLSKYSKVGFVHPVPRGWVNETDQVAPCGGLSVNNRTTWPLTGGQFSLLLAGEAFSVQFSYATLENPTKDSDFKPLMQSFTGGDQVGHTCFGTPDFGSLGMTVGESVTVQVEYLGEGSDMTPYYQCADLTIVETTSYAPANYTCMNALEPLSSFLSGDSTGTSDGAAATVTVTVTSSPHVGLSSAAAGAIGAGVTIGVFGLLLGALFALGVLAIGGKKNKNAAVVPMAHDDHSSKNSVDKNKF